MWIGPGNAQGEPVTIAEAGDHMFGLGLVNDWSARDIQLWECRRSGPSSPRISASTVSPWIVTIEALAPFRASQPPRPAGDPKPLPYLWDDARPAERRLRHRAGGVDRDRGDARARDCRRIRYPHSNTTDLYWTVAQMVAHHTCGGCNLMPGDLFGTGTISGATPEGYGSMMELSAAGERTISLPSGETRTFLEDGDEVIFRAHARRDGYAPIGFGECRGRIAG